MQNSAGYLEKLYLAVKTRPGIFWFALSVALILAGWKIWDFQREVSQTHILISMKSSVDGTAQFYYDIGSGLSESDSITVSVKGDRSYHDYRFQLPRLPVYSMRFDPLMSEGVVAIRQVRWLDGRGGLLQGIDLAKLQPLNGIGSFTVAGDVFDAVIQLNAVDPQLGVQLTRPVMISRVDFLWRHPVVTLMILFEFVVVFLILAILLALWFAWKECIVSLLRNGKVPGALLLALIAVIAVENKLQSKLPGAASYHEVDELLYHLQAKKIDAAYMLLGDSVGRQLFMNTPHLQGPKFAMLATNQAITMTGQYFIARRYLSRNEVPRAVVLYTTNNFHSGLDSALSDNYIQRTFTDFSEILEVFRLKRDPVFTAKTLAYRLLPSFKYRLYLQKQWVGYANAESYTGIAYADRGKGEADYSLLKVLKFNIQEKNIPQQHFISLLAVAHDLHIPLFFLSPAINEHGKYGMVLHKQYSNLCERLFPDLQKIYPHFYYGKQARLLSREYFVDGSHFNEVGLKIETRHLYDEIRVIQKLTNDSSIN